MSSSCPPPVLLAPAVSPCCLQTTRVPQSPHTFLSLAGRGDSAIQNFIQKTTNLRWHHLRPLTRFHADPQLKGPLKVQSPILKQHDLISHYGGNVDAGTRPGRRVVSRPLRNIANRVRRRRVSADAPAVRVRAPSLWLAGETRTPVVSRAPEQLSTGRINRFKFFYYFSSC